METIDHETGLPVEDAQFAYSRQSSGRHHDSGNRHASTGMPGAVVWVVLALIYFIMPDFIPGPIDDILINAAALANLANKHFNQKKVTNN